MLKISNNTIYVCDRCGSPQIHALTWLPMNQNQVSLDNYLSSKFKPFVSDDKQYVCPKCKIYVQPVNIEAFLEAKYQKELHKETAQFELFLNGPFSNWHHSPFTMEYITFLNEEQHMMYEKAVLFGDFETADAIMEATHPSDIKLLGRNVKNFEASVWDLHKESAVFAGLQAKFLQNPSCMSALLRTGNKILVEASPVDAIWGIGLDGGDPDCNDPDKWLGQNLLGKLLTILKYTFQIRLNNESFTQY